MKVKVFYPDKNGKISFTKEELQALLDEVYKEGYNDARPYYWTTPSWTYRDSNTITTPYTYTTTALSSDGTNCTTTLNQTEAYAGSVLTASNSEAAPEPAVYQVEFRSA